MRLHNRHIGVWGFGYMGQSVASYAQRHGAYVTVFDTRVEQPYYDQERRIWFAPQHDVYTTSYEYLIPSPGVNINKHPHLIPWCLPEYDLYAILTTSPHIGITGSLGKTTITSCIAHLLNDHGITANYGGNIGIPMFSLLDTSSLSTYHVLELSSFQLEHIAQAAPDIAVISNFHPNHLDRHETVDAYLQAKCNILRHQNEHQNAIIPISLRQAITYMQPSRAFYVIATSRDEYLTYYGTLHANDIIYYIDDEQLYTVHHHTTHKRGSLPPTVTFANNWLIIMAIFDILEIPLLTHKQAEPEHCEHRREYVGTYNTIACYNDSKATIMPATCAAVQSLSNYPITLILGGLSKGVNRAKYIAQIAHQVTHVICFGREAHELYTMCEQHNISAHQTKTLSDAVTQAFACTQRNGIILFSPGGSSFDLFHSYQERGNAFKHYVTASKRHA